MLTVDRSRKASKKDVQMHVNQKLTRGELYLFYKELNYKSILKKYKTNYGNN